MAFKNGSARYCTSRAPLWKRAAILLAKELHRRSPLPPALSTIRYASGWRRIAWGWFRSGSGRDGRWGCFQILSLSHAWKDYKMDYMDYKNLQQVLTDVIGTTWYWHRVREHLFNTPRRLLGASLSLQDTAAIVLALLYHGASISDRTVKLLSINSCTEINKTDQLVPFLVTPPIGLPGYSCATTNML